MGRRWFSRRGSPWILANSQARGFASKEKESKRLHKKTVRKSVRDTKSTDPPTARASKIVSLLTQPPALLLPGKRSGFRRRYKRRWVRRYVPSDWVLCHPFGAL